MVSQGYGSIATLYLKRFTRIYNQQPRRREGEFYRTNPAGAPAQTQPTFQGRFTRVHRSAIRWLLTQRGAWFLGGRSFAKSPPPVSRSSYVARCS
jgi:hypothetical protein